MWALEQFRSRLHQWPQYCSLICGIPHLRSSQPELVASLESFVAAHANGTAPPANAESASDDQAVAAAFGGNNGADTGLSPAAPPISAFSSGAGSGSGSGSGSSSGGGSSNQGSGVEGQPSSGGSERSAIGGASGSGGSAPPPGGNNGNNGSSHASDSRARTGSDAGEEGVARSSTEGASQEGETDGQQPSFNLEESVDSLLAGQDGDAGKKGAASRSARTASSDSRSPRGSPPDSPRARGRDSGDNTEGDEAGGESKSSGRPRRSPPPGLSEVKSSSPDPSPSPPPGGERKGNSSSAAAQQARNEAAAAAFDDTDNNSASDGENNDDDEKPKKGLTLTLTAGQPFGGSLNIDTLLAAEVARGPLPATGVPSEAIKDKIHFIINNVSKTMLRQKAKELKAVLRPEFYLYFARYLVVRRVSTEANFHKVYAQFIEAVGLAQLSSDIVQSTYDNIKALLDSEKILVSSSERSLLKNLGAWLGLLTIAKNKPLLARQLALKDLIIDACTSDKDRLIAIIPFVKKILESCAKSKIFRPPNPWLMGLVSLLKEIYDLPGFKLHNKFEIEVLLHTLGIKMKDIKASTLLRGSGVGRPATMEAKQEEPSGEFDDPNLRQSNQGQQGGRGTSSPSLPPTSGGPLQSPTNGGQANTSGPPGQQEFLVANLPAFVRIHPDIPLFSMFPALKLWVPSALDRAIREIISPVVERSVTIAVVTTRELIVKDFQFEPDDLKMLTAAHQMVQNLTSSLALVTCKEPLRVSINNHLGALLDANASAADRQLVEHACGQVSTDNLELGCTIIEKAASDRAIREIDDALAPVIALRNKLRAQTGLPYYPTPATRFPSSLPEQLRPKPGGLTSSQLRVYDDFTRIRHQHAQGPMLPEENVKGSEVTSRPRAGSNSRSTTPSLGGSASASPSVPPTGNAPISNVPSSTSGAATSQQTLDKLIHVLAQLESAVARFPNHASTALAALPSLGVRDDHEINALLRLVPQILHQCPRDEPNFPRDVVAFTFAHKVFKRMYERECRASLLQIDVHIAVLKAVRVICSKIVKELTTWLLFPEDERKFLIDITVPLMRARMLVIPDVDTFLSKMLLSVQASGQAIGLATPSSQPGVRENRLHQNLEFALVLVRRLLVKEPVLGAGDLPHVLEVLSKMSSAARSIVTSNPSVPGGKPVPQSVLSQKVLHETLAHLLDEVAIADRENRARAALEAKAATAAQQVAATAPQNVEVNDTKPGSGVAPAVANVGGLWNLSLADEDEVDELDLAERERIEREARERANKEDGKDKPERKSSSSTPPVLGEEKDEESPLARNQATVLLEEWINICSQASISEKMYARFLGMLQAQRVLANADATSRFFRILVQLCINSAFRPGPSAPVPTGGMPQQLDFTAIDALARLVVCLVRYLEPGAATPGGATDASGQPVANPQAAKLRLLRAFLTSAAAVLRKDHAAAAVGIIAGSSGARVFNQRPYLRLFANLLHDFNTPDPHLDSNNVDVLGAFGSCFRLLRPTRVPAFSFAWLELISHRMFMSKLLISKSPQCSMLFARLLVDLFVFMQPYLRNAELTDPIRLLYKGTLRVLLVLLHDFPEHLCEFHFTYCDVIPSSCIQMRNLILSAFPRNMRLPDPFTPNLKVDLLPEITQPPRIVSDVTASLATHRSSITGFQLLSALDSYLKNRGPPTFLKQLLASLQLPSDAVASIKKAGTTYNVPLINSLVLYVGQQGIAKLQNKSQIGSQFQDNACMDIFEALVSGLDPEGRYYVLNAIANQLRYPNNHTHYFSCVLLYLFLQSKQEVVKEQITRVLLERLIVHRPHPWGLLITFIGNYPTYPSTPSINPHINNDELVNDEQMCLVRLISNDEKHINGICLSPLIHITFRCITLSFMFPF
jgi:hypothetical protein